MRFFSDNTSSACPEILAAIAAANHGLARAYGDDDWTQRLDRPFSDFFGTAVRAFAVTTGTAANSLSLATLSPPYGGDLRPRRGAHRRATSAARRDSSPAARSWRCCPESTAVWRRRPWRPRSLRTASTCTPCSRRRCRSPRRPSSARSTGPRTSPSSRAHAHAHGLKVHMDGARFANALVLLGCHPGDITWRAGVDVLSFGATKNGALGAEAVVFFDAALVRDFELRRKRAGHLLSKSRYAAAQLLAYVASGVWQRNAARSNRLAQDIGRAAGAALLHPVEANEVFLGLGVARRERLRAAGFEFYDWGAAGRGEARFVVSWDQPEQDVPALCAALGRL